MTAAVDAFWIHTFQAAFLVENGSQYQLSFTMLREQVNVSLIHFTRANFRFFWFFWIPISLQLLLIFSNPHLPKSVLLDWTEGWCQCKCQRCVHSTHARDYGSEFCRQQHVLWLECAGTMECKTQQSCLVDLNCPQDWQVKSEFRLLTPVAQ